MRKDEGGRVNVCLKESIPLDTLDLKGDTWADTLGGFLQVISGSAGKARDPAVTPSSLLCLLGPL